MSENLILIVDDEPGVSNTLQQVLEDEGFSTLATGTAKEAFSLIEEKQPVLVMLDIWLPEMDGMEALQKIREKHVDLPVIMISGHATISTAVKATQLGAVDFIEKPLDLDTTLKAVRNAFFKQPVSGDWIKQYDLAKLVFNEQKLCGEALPQKTLKESRLLYGVGVHSGKKSGLLLQPLPENSGIHFAGVNSKETVPAHLNYITTTGYATTIKNVDFQVSTIEHLLSALHAYGISNLLIKCNEEVPVMDGSALEFCKIIEETGVKEQDAKVFEIAVDRELVVGGDKEWIKIEAQEKGFTIDYTLRYPEPIGEQHFIFTLDSPENYKKEIAPSRTFAFVKDVAYLQQQGLAQGGRFDNFILIGEDGVINSELRFENEQVRHKILDMIGDLYLLGRPIRGKVTACMTGHSDNAELLSQILEILSLE